MQIDLKKTFPAIEWSQRPARHVDMVCARVTMRRTLDGQSGFPFRLIKRTNRQGQFPYYGASGIIDSIDGYTHDGEYVLIGEDGANLLARSTSHSILS